MTFCYHSFTLPIKKIGYYLLFLALLAHTVAFGQWTNANEPSDDSVTDLIVDGQNLFVSNHGSGVFYSADNGSTWKSIKNGLNSTFYYALATDGTTVLAGTNNGVYKSTDKGNTWTNIYGGTPGVIVQRVAIHNNVLYAWVYETGIIRSDDNGVHWTVCNEGLDLTAYTFIKDFHFYGSIVFLGTSRGMYRSDNNGTSWVPINSGLTNTNVVALARVGTTLFAGVFDGLFRSDNDGKSWQKVNVGFLNGTDFVSDLTVEGDGLYVASNKAGVFKSADGGSTWTAMNDGLITLELSAIAANETSLFTGTMRKGVWKHSLASVPGVPGTWTTTNGPIVPGVVTDLATLNSNLFATVHDVGVFKSTDNGTGWTKVSSGIASTLFSKVGINQTSIFVGTRDGVFRSMDNGNTWAAVGLSNVFIRSLAVNGNTVFAGTDSGIFRSTDNGATWLAVNNGLGSSYFINDILQQEQNVYAATAFGLYRSLDNGSTWTVGSGSVGNLNIRVLERKGTSLYAGTGSGVYRSTDNGATWALSGSGMGNLPVTALFSTKSLLFAAVSSNAGEYIYFSQNDGTNWQVMGENTASIISAFAANTNFVFAATSNKGVWRSSLEAPAPELSYTSTLTNFTTTVGVPSSVQSFTVSGTHLMGNVTVSAPAGFEMSLDVNAGFTSSLSLSPVSGNLENIIIYVRCNPATAGEFSGVITIKTSGAGDKTIAVTGSAVESGQWIATDGPKLQELITDLTATRSALFANAYNTGIFRSVDNGATWTNVTTGTPGSGFVSLAAEDNAVYAGTNIGLFKSTDDGASWKSLGLDGRFVNALALNGSTIVVASYKGEIYSGGTVWRSQDRGASWTEVNTGLNSNPGLIIYDVLIHGENVYLGTSNGIFRSTKNGTTWTAVNTGLTNTFTRALAAIGNTLFAGTINGVFISNNNGETWTASAGTADDGHVSALFAHDAMLFVSSQKDGQRILSTTTNGNTWTETTGGNLGGSSAVCFTYTNGYIFAGSYSMGVWSYTLENRGQGNPSGKLLTVNTLGSHTVCAGATLYVPFTATGTYSTENVFTVQLSDENGDFGAALTAIGTSTTSSSGTITAAIPAGTKPGSNYRIRVVASAPAVSGESYGTTIQIITAPGKPSVSVNGNILTSSSPSGNQWYLDGAPIKGANGQVYTAPLQGVYTVQVANSCAVSHLSEAVNLVLTVAETQEQAEIKVCPNPASGQFSIHLSHGLRLKSTEIYTLSGKSVQQNRFSGQEQAVIEVQQLPKGTYLVRIETQRGVLYKRVVVH